LINFQSFVNKRNPSSKIRIRCALFADRKGLTSIYNTRVSKFIQKRTIIRFTISNICSILEDAKLESMVSFNAISQIASKGNLKNGYPNLIVYSNKRNPNRKKRRKH
jgi:hypothetical protein